MIQFALHPQAALRDLSPGHSRDGSVWGFQRRAQLACGKPSSQRCSSAPVSPSFLIKTQCIMRQMGPVFGMQIWPAELQPGRATWEEIRPSNQNSLSQRFPGEFVSLAPSTSPTFRGKCEAQAGPLERTNRCPPKNLGEQSKLTPRENENLGESVIA